MTNNLHKKFKIVTFITISLCGFLSTFVSASSKVGIQSPCYESLPETNSRIEETQTRLLIAAEIEAKDREIVQVILEINQAEAQLKSFYQSSTDESRDTEIKQLIEDLAKIKIELTPLAAEHKVRKAAIKQKTDELKQMGQTIMSLRTSIKVDDPELSAKAAKLNEFVAESGQAAIAEELHRLKEEAATNEEPFKELKITKKAKTDRLKQLRSEKAETLAQLRRLKAEKTQKSATFRQLKAQRAEKLAQLRRLSSRK
ncbi:MAG: hypothetical protein LBT69_03795 [Lactobacillales bacterium]|jgi:predicted dienelactone hydrolase|nr:hypothetical protein [Lactobacillales bacterium]